MGRILLAIFEFILIIGAAYGLASFFKKNSFKFTSLDYIILRIVLGFGILSFITLILASLSLLNTSFFVLIIFSGNALLFMDRSIIKSLKFNKNISIWTLILIIFILFNLFYSLFPPTFYDSMMYHLAVPNYYLLNDGIVPWNSNFNSNLPLNVEMIFLFSLLGKTVLIPKLISLFSGILILLLLLFWIKEHRSKFIYFLPLLLFYSIPQVGFLSSSSKTDLTGILFALSAIRVFIYFIDHKKRQYLILSGVFWGFAIGSKYIFGFYMIAFFIAILFIRSIKVEQKISSIIIISILVIILMMPWFIKNTIITGNPLYPYLNNYFNSNSWTEAQSSSFSTGIQRGAEHTFLQYLYFPLELFLKPYSYGITAVYGMLFLFFFPFLFFTEKKDHIKILKISGLSSFILIMPFALVPRYFLMSFLLLAIPIASGVLNVLKKKPNIKKYILFVFSLLIVFNLAMQISLQEKIFQGFSYLKVKFNTKDSSDESKLNYLYTLPNYRVLEFLNKNLSAKDKVLFLGEDRSFYLKKKFYLSSFNDNNKLIDLIRRETHHQSILKIMKGENITHFLFSEKGLERMSKMSSVYQISDQQKENLLCFFSNLKIVYQDNLYKIYKF